MIVYAPWFALGTAVLLAPSQREMRAREEYLAEEVLARSEREYLNRLPVTPKESAAWVGRCALTFAPKRIVQCACCPGARTSLR